MDERDFEFSVIVPVYNAIGTLPVAVASVLNQGEDVEVVLVDDGSAQETARLCKELAAQHTRIQLIQKPNGGSLSARLAGVRAAKGAYILFLDADDIYFENAFSQFRKDIEATSADMYLYDYLMDCDKGARQRNVKPIESEKTQLFTEKNMHPVYDAFMRGPLNTMCATVYCAEILQATLVLEGMPKMRVSEDRLQKLFAVKAAKKVLYTPYTCYHYKWYSTSQYETARCNKFIESLYQDYRTVWSYERGAYADFKLSQEEILIHDTKKINRIVSIVESLLALKSEEYEKEKKRNYLNYLRNDEIFKILVTSDAIKKVRLYGRVIIKLSTHGHLGLLTAFYRLRMAIKNLNKKSVP